MKIVFLSTGHWYHDFFPARGGWEAQIEELAHGLSRKGHEITILTRDRGFKEKYLGEIRILGVKNNLGPYSSEENMRVYALLSRILFSWNAYELLRNLDFDVLSMWERFSAYFPSHLSVPKLYRPDWDDFDYAKKFLVSQKKVNYIFFPVKQWVAHRVMRNSDKVIATNKSIKTYLGSKGFDNVVIIPHGIATEFFRNEGDENFVLYAGRLSPSKGVEYLIQAFAKITPQHSDYKLVIIGKGNEKPKLMKMAKTLGVNGRIDFIDWMPKEELMTYYAKCSIFVLPSMFETFGNVIIEAMASEKPVIASNIVGPKDIVTHGRNGFLFEAGDSNQLAKYLDILISDRELRRKMGQRGRQYVKRRFASDLMTKKFIAVCEDVLNKPINKPKV